jgi:hypothetical protein
MENTSASNDNASETASHKRRDSLATRIQNAVKLPSLNTSNILSGTSSLSAPGTPYDQEMFNLTISLNPEDYELLDPIGINTHTHTINFAHFISFMNNI